MSGILGTNAVVQIGIIVNDIEVTKRKYAEFLGMPVPDTLNSGDYEITQTEYRGNPAPKASCYMTFFNIEGAAQIELIQPNDEPSVWREFLNEKGEGIHHIGFAVKGTKEKVAICEGFGMELVQKGEYGDASGQYSYLDAYDNLKILVELLESYK